MYGSLTCSRASPIQGTIGTLWIRVEDCNDAVLGVLTLELEGLYRCNLEWVFTALYIVIAPYKKPNYNAFPESTFASNLLTGYYTAYAFTAVCLPIGATCDMRII
jgi:hypothetical protein